MYEEPSTRKTWSPFFGANAGRAGVLGALSETLGFAAGMDGMWAVRPPVATSSRRCLPGCGSSEERRPGRSELDHVAARERHLVGNDGGPALVQMPGGILLHVGVFGRDGIDRHDNLVAALRRSAAGPEDHALRRGTGHDHRPDGAVFQPL